MLARHGSIGIFSCEFLERVNKKQRKFILHHSNHADTCDTRLAMIRSQTRPVKREKRGYTRKETPATELPLLHCHWWDVDENDGDYVQPDWVTEAMTAEQEDGDYAYESEEDEIVEDDSEDDSPAPAPAPAPAFSVVLGSAKTRRSRR